MSMTSLYFASRSPKNWSLASFKEFLNGHDPAGPEWLRSLDLIATQMKGEQGHRERAHKLINESKDPKV
jgi:hypothetical protein